LYRTLYFIFPMKKSILRRHKEKHKEKHKEFKETILDMKSQIDEGKAVYSLEISNLIRDWLLEHIKIEDKKYAECFNANGLR